MTTLVFGPQTLRGLLGAVRSPAEDERCGVVFGLRLPSGEGQVLGCAELTNAHKSPAANYAFDPDQQAAVWQKVEAMGYEVLGVWHSHPHGPQAPSTTDIEYMQPWLVYPILMPTMMGVSMAVYRLTEAGDSVVTVPHEARMQPA